MKVLFARGIEDYLEKMDGVDIVILITPLFLVNLFPVTERAVNTLYDIDWDRAVLYPIIRFSFFPTTKSEIIGILRAVAPGIEIIDEGGLPVAA